MASKVIEKKRLRKKRNLNRSRASKQVLPIILIVCEGKNTEPSYFNQLKFKTARVEAVGEGYNTISLIDRAEFLSKQDTYDEVWCVFDKDDFTNYNFNSAIYKAEGMGFKVAYSNQAFEYWLILHFNDHQGGALHRDQYNEMINRAIVPLGAEYDGNGCKIITSEFFNLLFSNEPQTKKSRYKIAIERAKRLDDKLNHNSYAKEESSTTVFKLLEHLLSFKLY